MAQRLVHFGAGNIGRSFIGALFARAGYEVVFVDVDDTLVKALNARGSYTVVIKHPDGRDEACEVTGVRAVDGRDTDAVVDALTTARFASTAVGKGALRNIVPTLAAALRRRHDVEPDHPLDLILAENARDAASIVYDGLAATLGEPAWLEGAIGLVETSIGKMVPIMPAEVVRKDPLLVFAEPYNTLIVDRHGFRTPLPQVAELHPVDNIQAYVDRKLFIHNLGHATVAYRSFARDRSVQTIWEAMTDAEIATAARTAMEQAAAALHRTYRDDLPAADLAAHIDDLLERFTNRSLGDTVFRVGRDLRRKLARDDRLVGAMLLCASHGLPFGAIAHSYVAALSFSATDDRGAPFEPDAELLQELTRAEDRIMRALTSLSGLDPREATDAAVIAAVRAAVGN